MTVSQRELSAEKEKSRSPPRKSNNASPRSIRKGGIYEYTPSIKSIERAKSPVDSKYDTLEK